MKELNNTVSPPQKIRDLIRNKHAKDCTLGFIDFSVVMIDTKYLDHQLRQQVDEMRKTLYLLRHHSREEIYSFMESEMNKLEEYLNQKQEQWNDASEKNINIEDTKALNKRIVEGKLAHIMRWIDESVK